MARDQKVVVLVDAAEKRAIVRAAKKARISTARWARESLLAAVGTGTNGATPEMVGSADANGTEE